MMKSRKWQPYRLLMLGALLFICVGCSIRFGTVGISFGECISLFTKGNMTPEASILLYVRLPRVLGGLFAGAALAAAGMIVQSVLSNPLASPNIIGVNAGAGFFVALSITLFPTILYLVPIMAFLGALLTMFTIYLIARKTKASRTTVVLAGIAINSIVNAGTDIVHVLHPTTILSTIEFRVGGLHAIDGKVLLPACIMIVGALIILRSICTEIEVLTLGDEMAHSLGLHTERIRFLALTLAAVLAGAAVSFSGLLGFVGLIVPHIARFLVGSEIRYLLPASVMLGGSLVLLSDLLARVIVKPYELPAGIVLAILGVPFFFYLLFSKKRGIRHD